MGEKNHVVEVYVQCDTIYVKNTQNNAECFSWVHVCACKYVDKDLEENFANW